MRLLTRNLPGKTQALQRAGRTLIPLCALSVTACLKSLVYPAPDYPVPSPAPEPFQEIRLKPDAHTKIFAWEYVFPARPGIAPRPNALYLHGNGENLGMLWKGGILEELAGLEVNLLVPDYPGYGRSTGTPSRTSLTAMGRVALKYMETVRPDSPRVLLGHSLGAAVALQIASGEQANLAGMILISPFTTLRDVARLHFSRCLAGPAPLENYDSRSIAREIKIPVLVLHGARDRLIPPEQGLDLARNLAGPAEYIAYANAGHNDIVDAPETLERMRRFMEAIRRNHSPVTPGKGLNQDANHE